ncbi:MAG TPA: VOC family protein [Hyphomicrobiaceae bacterium]|nr:VOC family protein [Hyphomicrobiaceae bacterium]
MSPNFINPVGTIVPTLRYRDVATAIDWLCNALGFEEHLVVKDEDGSVRYAELTFGNGMIMLGPVDETSLDKAMAQPADTGGAETYLFVADVSAHSDRAKAAGAHILLDIDDAHSDGRSYSCRDLEGHVWNLGTYDPWKREAARPDPPRRSRSLTVAMGSLVAATASLVLAGWLVAVRDVSDFGIRLYASSSIGEAATGAPSHLIVGDNEPGNTATADRLAKERAERRTALSAASESQVELARKTLERTTNPPDETEATAEAERALDDARRQLADERSAREQAQRGAQEARERLSLVERTGQSMQEQLVAERNARHTAEIAAQQARQQLAKEHDAKAATQRALKEARLAEAKGRAAARRLAPRPRGLPSMTESRS